jgi:aryl-alcohol dehydrogenase-like predicted oxidoreductase
MASLRPLGRSELMVSSIALGCWPIAGVTSLDVNPEDSLKTLHAAIDAGVNFFDSAYSYGIKGESECLIGQAIRGRRKDVVVATKGGLHRVGKGQAHDARPETLIRECEESLQRLKIEQIDLYYLHAPDPDVPVSESAGAIKELMECGKVRYAGASNLNVYQLDAFHQVCPLTAVQPHYNMLQREIEADIMPWCVARKIGLCVYWPLMKGLLAGRLPRDHQFVDADGRKKYPMFQGDEWQKNQNFMDDLKVITQAVGCEVSQLVLAWTIQQPGIISALCGAKRAWQITETAAAMDLHLSQSTLAAIQSALTRRGQPYSVAAV